MQSRCWKLVTIFGTLGYFYSVRRTWSKPSRPYAPQTLDLVSQAVNEASTDLGSLRLASEPWSQLEDISIDYAIMEKAQNLVAVPYASKWSDLGGWDAVWSESNPDTSGNVTSETAHAIECKNSLLRSESCNQQVVGIGLR